MIVMKFGGSSLASPASMKRVAAIVRSKVQKASAIDSVRQNQVLKCPVVIASAIGNTTDQLLEILEYASRAEAYLAWKLMEQLKAYHFCLAEDLLGPERLEPIDRYIRFTFRDLHVRMLELCDGACSVTPELRDWVASLGEKLSSRIVAAMLEENGLRSKHLESEKLIVTDDHFTNATPRYWETYARIRWAVPIAARSHVVVLGGFIGATEDGRTTTLGRGGSDLTASIVGAAVNADEIQVWKDVDGMLTWDPRIKAGAHRVRSLSYEEANELARAGAVILHPDAVAPARRFRIPVVIRNTFRPNGEGTRIGALSAICSSPVKSIACKTNATVLELRSLSNEAVVKEWSSSFEQVCHQQKTARLLAVSEEAIYLELDAGSQTPELDIGPSHCVQAHVRNGQAIITLVGEAIRARKEIAGGLAAALGQRSALILPKNDASCSLQIVVAQEQFGACIDILQALLFTELDPAFFAPVEVATAEQELAPSGETTVYEQEQVFSPFTNRFALPALRT